MIEAILFLLGSSFLTLYLLKSYLSGGKKFWKSNGFEVVSTKYGVIERLLAKKSMADVDEDLYHQLKKKNLSFGVNVEMRQPVVFIADPEFIKIITIKDFDYFVDRRHMLSKDSDPILVNMLFNMGGKDWKDMRGLLSPTFTTGKIRRMFDIFNSRANVTVEYLKAQMEDNRNGKVINISDIMGRITIDTIGSVAFGIDSNAIKDPKAPINSMWKKMQNVTFLGLVKTFLIFTVPQVIDFLGVSFLEQKSRDYFISALKQTLKRREMAKEQRGDFVQIMLEAKERQLKISQLNDKSNCEEDENNVVESKLKITDDLILAQAFMYLLAGFDPVESVLICLMYEMALNQDIQDKLAEEVNKCYDSEGFNYDTVNQIDYLERVIAEGLRKHDPAFRTERKCVIDYKVPGTNLVIPKGTMIALPINAFHLDPEYYPNPEIFDPDRFLPEEKAKRHPYSYLPFGHGPRNCLGNRFALMETKTVLATIVRNFIIEPCEKTKIPIEKGIIGGGANKPCGQIHLSLKIRTYN